MYGEIFRQPITGIDHRFLGDEPAEREFLNVHKVN